MKTWKSKIVGHDRVDPRSLTLHPQNPRLHPQAQSEALVAAIEAVGYIDSVTVNKRTNHVVNGNDRVTQAIKHGQSLIDVEFVDLTPEDELIALATIDPIAAMARVDEEKMANLLRDHAPQAESLKNLMKNTLSKTFVGPDVDDTAPFIAERFAVVVECDGEADQLELLRRFNEEGLKCRALVV